jgi:hypothetical protein
VSGGILHVDDDPVGVDERRARHAGKLPAERKAEQFIGKAGRGRPAALTLAVKRADHVVGQFWKYKMRAMVGLVFEFSFLGYKKRTRPVRVSGVMNTLPAIRSRSAGRTKEGTSFKDL